MTSLAETVSSAIIERHPEIGTLKKINAVKEYMDDGAISKGKSLRRVNVPYYGSRRRSENFWTVIFPVVNLK